MEVLYLINILFVLSHLCLTCIHRLPVGKRFDNALDDSSPQHGTYVAN
jgi:hypothetical protein